MIPDVQNVEGLEHSYTAEGNVKCHIHLGKQLTISWKVQLQWYDSAILIPGIYKRKLNVCALNCIWIFIVALFITAQSWKQYKCHSTGEDKLWLHPENGMLLRKNYYYYSYAGWKFQSKSVVWFHLYKIVENENYNDRKQSSDCLIRGKRMAGNKY